MDKKLKDPSACLEAPFFAFILALEKRGRWILSFFATAVFALMAIGNMVTLIRFPYGSENHDFTGGIIYAALAAVIAESFRGSLDVRKSREDRAKKSMNISTSLSAGMWLGFGYLALHQYWDPERIPALKWFGPAAEWQHRLGLAASMMILLAAWIVANRASEVWCKARFVHAGAAAHFWLSLALFAMAANGLVRPG